MILCCGEALIDMIPEAVSAGREGFVPHSGGAIFNTAIALGRLETPVAMLTGLSTDLFGEQLIKDLAKSNVETSLVVRKDRPTTLAFVHLMNGHATYQFYDENTAGRTLSTDELPELPQDIQALYFGGISLASEPSGDTYARFLEKAGENRLVMIDPNIRPSFVEDEGRYRQRLSKMIEQTTIVKISDEDLAWIAGQDVPTEVAVKNLLERGPSMVILTAGSAGATAYLKNGKKIQVSALKVSVVDTVGAGDTFNAGVLSMLSQLGLLTPELLEAADDEAIEKALSFGAKVASVTVSRSGANPPWAHELS